MPHPPQRVMYVASHDPNNWGDEWFRQLGFVGYYFGQLVEWAPWWLADQAGSQTQQSKLPTKTFAGRCDFAKTALVPKLTDPVLQQEWLGILDEVDACRKMRNVILHSPLELNVSEIGARGITIDQGILQLHKRGRPILQLGDVQHFTNSMINIHQRIISLMGRTQTAQSTMA